MEPKEPRDYWILQASSTKKLEQMVRMQCKLDDWVPLGGMTMQPRYSAGSSQLFFQTICTPAMMNRTEAVIEGLADTVRILADELDCCRVSANAAYNARKPFDGEIPTHSKFKSFFMPWRAQ